MSAIQNNILAGASGQGGYEIQRSLRFNDDDTAYLSRTPSSATNRRTSTFSCWVKRGTIGTFQTLFAGRVSSGNFFKFQIRDDNRFEINTAEGADSTVLVSTSVYRDVSAWYHIVIAFDTTQATSTNRVKFYVNGTQVTNFDTSTYPPQNTDTHINNTGEHLIGNQNATSRYFDGYMTEVNFVDGTALAASDFGETDTETGAWIPKKYSGSYGTNGFYLNFSDNSSVSALGTDSSGNGNTWTPNNFSVTAGTGNDSLEDTPTNNYSTLNPLDKTGGSMFQGNLTYAGVYSDVVTRNGHGARSTLKVPSSGKWYLECANITYTGAGNSCYLALTSSEQKVSDASGFGGTLTPFIGVDANVFNNKIYLRWAGVSGGTTSGTILFTSYASGDIVNFAIDFDDGKFWVGKNGTWYNSGNPAAGTNATCTFTAGTKPWGFWAEYVSSSDNSNRSSPRVNFGQQGFEYTAPSGFLEMNTANLPVPTIKDGSDYFNTVLYTGNGTSQSITGVGFQPDWVWIKKRSASENHELQDSVRGATKRLASNSTAAEITIAGSISSFDSDGFTVGNAGTTNENTFTYVAWNWLAGGSSSSNANGSITSTVSANVDAGFSIVTWSGNSTAGTSIGHGLNDAPSMIIVKRRDAAGYNWPVYHKAVGEGTGTNKPYGYLNLTAAFNTTGPAAIFDTNANAHTDSVFYVGNNVNSNATGGTYVAYCFAEVEGFSKFGSYTGNGSSDGPFVHCGFRPAMIWTKRADGTTNWYEFDDKRNPFNLTDNRLELNSNAAEYDGYNNNHDLLSNGFKLRSSDAGSNGSGGTYIFAAWAANPFKYANAR